MRWSDGVVGEAVRWYDDEIRVPAGDLLGRTHGEIRQLQFLRDRDYLQSPGD